MRSQKAACMAIVLPCLILASCKGDTTNREISVSGVKSGIASLERIAGESFLQNRSSGPLGIFAGLYLSQGIFLPAKSALLGMDVMRKFLEAHSQSDSEENFALLREVGDVLQISIVDLLNRSSDRRATIDEYVSTLKNTTRLLEQKVTELAALYERQQEESKEKRTATRDIDRKLKTVLKELQYAQASDLQEQLTKGNAAFAEISAKEAQTKDMIARMETLLKIGQERLRAIENNREILIAGLRVIDVPGIEDFNILEDGKRWNTRKKSPL